MVCLCYTTNLYVQHYFHPAAPHLHVYHLLLNPALLGPLELQDSELPPVTEFQNLHPLSDQEPLKLDLS